MNVSTDMASRTLQFVWFFVAPAIVSAQEPPKIESVTLNGNEVKLRWSGNAKAYGVEMASDLPDWSTAKVTSDTDATISVFETPVYFRVRAFDDDMELTRESDERIALLETIREKVASVPESTTSEENTAIADYLRSVNELSNVEISNGCVWSDFADGKTLMVVNNREVETDETFNPDGAAALNLDAVEPEEGREIRADSADPTGIPASKKAFIISSKLIGPTFENLIDWRIGGDLAAWLKDSGYEVRQSRATLWALSRVRNAGVLFYEGHGALRQSNKGYAIVSDTTVRESISQTLRNMIDGYSIVKLKPESGIHYLVAEGFIRNMTFGKNGLAFLNSCHSASSAGFFAPDNVAHFGWTAEVGDKWAWRSARFFFDRLLGANRGFDLIRSRDFHISPPQRPFDVVPVYEVMKGLNLTASTVEVDDKKVAANLLFQGKKDAFGILAPSIERMNVEEHLEQLRITGSFDPDAPTRVSVKRSGKMRFINPTSVKKDEILCPLKAQDEPSAGDIQVSQNDHKGNSIPLTEWRLKAMLTRNFAGITELQATTEAELHFRADVHSGRRIPEEKPSFPGASAGLSSDSKGRLVSASGCWMNSGVKTEWQPNHSGTIPVEDLRGTLQIDRNGKVTIFAATRLNNGVKVIRTNADGSKQMFMTEGGTAAQVGGVQSSMSFGDYSIRKGEGKTGSTGRFWWESTRAMWPPTSNFAR